MADPTTTARDTRTDTSPVDTPFDTRLERVRAQRNQLKDRHTQRLSRLLAEREDLHGVHALADLVHESLRWSA